MRTMQQNVLRISLASGVLLLTGCATTSRPVSWRVPLRPGADAQTVREAFERNKYECSRDAMYTTVSGGGGYLVGDGYYTPQSYVGIPVTSRQRFNEGQYYMCMESKGYHRACHPGYHLNDDRDKCKPDSEK